MVSKTELTIDQGRELIVELSEAPNRACVRSGKRFTLGLVRNIADKSFPLGWFAGAGSNLPVEDYEALLLKCMSRFVLSGRERSLSDLERV